jgi:hypothetical protein
MQFDATKCVENSRGGQDVTVASLQSLEVTAQAMRRSLTHVFANQGFLPSRNSTQITWFAPVLFVATAARCKSTSNSLDCNSVQALVSFV